MNWRVSQHALDRALDMGVQAEEIRDAMFRPRDVHWNAAHQSWYYTRGRVTLCVVDDRDTPGGLVVTTVLWARASDWAADVALGALRGRSGEYDRVRRVRAARRRKGKK